MIKPIKEVGAWLGDVFGGSHKAISEKLSAEEYSQLIIDAGKYRQSEEGKQLDDEADKSKQVETPDPAKPEPKNTDFEARLVALEGTLLSTQNELQTEKEKTAGLTQKLTEKDTQLTDTKTKLATSEEQKTKLRQAVNPLGDQDISNQDGGTAGLTQSDIEARASYKANRSEE